jgi:putative tryptophan/tyrosine transport system substrate-binding protein
MTVTIGRRELLAALGGAAAAWPLAARAQQAALPVVGFLSSVSQAQTRHMVAAFQRGLGETGYVDARNVAIEYRFVDGQYDRLPALASEMVRRPVSLILAAGPPAALAAKVATTTIPIVFIVGFDPVGAGLVASFNRPGGNATGAVLVSGLLGQKRLELARDLIPKAAVVAMLANPLSPDAPPEIREVQAAAQSNGLQLLMLNASTPGEIESAFASLSGQHPDALLVGGDPFYMARREDIVRLVARSGLPAIYPFREFTETGGLISYGTNIANSYRQAGIYAGRILAGVKPSDLPVMQPTTFELVINLKTAKTLGFDIPPTLHARSDEVIE